MGISGLTTYISDRANLYLLPFELRDTHLVIDGNALTAKLYLQQNQSNCCFGGDYNKFAETVCNFFDKLASCNVTPLVIIDGAYEKKRIALARKRTKDRIRSVEKYQTHAQNIKYFPILLWEVFKDVLIEKGIKFTQTLFEADYNIASVARMFNCPVLSADSDFYVYDVMYIPIETLILFQIKNRSGTMPCKIYRVEKLLEQFKGLNRLHLPVAACLLGNDYTCGFMFENFFKNLMNYNPPDKRGKQHQIEATFQWLSKNSVQTAISQVLSTLPQEKQKKTLKIIEMVINIYTISDPQILIPLDFSKDFVSEMEKKFRMKPFKFLDFDGGVLTVDETETGDLKTDNEKLKDDPEFEHDLNIHKVAPLWFIEEFMKGKYSSYFIDILARRQYICPTQIEDYSYPGAIGISTDIISVINSLLTKDVQGPTTLTCLCRGEGRNLIELSLEALKKFSCCDLPNLFNLRNLSLDMRKKIMCETLGISDSTLDSFPDEWKLYLATAIFWMSRQEKSSETKLYSLLYGMLYGVVEKKVGYHESEQKFRQKYQNDMSGILMMRRNQSSEQLNHRMTVNEALNQVTFEDCLMAAPFFLKNCEMDRDLQSKRKQLKISTVHFFAQFQFCLQHSLNLNALLDCPYKQTKISEMFNGTLLYNLCTEFEKSHDADAVVRNHLQNSPNLQRLFKVLCN